MAKMAIDIENTKTFKAITESLAYLVNEKADEKDIAHINGVFERLGVDMEFEMGDIEPIESTMTICEPEE
ncbi:hypothetical protein CSV63_02930 [Sporosarcina sp. P34]|uniref:hypothetical protein n=1 Tax=Sporosarcina sp. P34 TaxID=2048247 RepID=UPI000C16C5EF|nr:hypothetical protein [Sporosarcina sp. P34]PID16859.1 hypothetical protein CSV63_02930 [Sporosarcina sp. P34]